MLLSMYTGTQSSNCFTKRSFSILKRVKNDLKLFMGEDQLNSLALLNHEANKYSTKIIDLNDIIESLACLVSLIQNSPKCCINIF